MRPEEGALRERELFAVLSAWDIQDGVVIGGYGVSARTLPRYSHDIDLLLPRTSLARARAVLEGGGLLLTKENPEVEQNYGGSFEQWSGGATRVTVELLVESVQDREFRIPLPYAVLADRAEVLPIRGLTSSPVQLPVACAEALIATKIQPMRAKDRGDICCLAAGPIDRRHLERLLRPLVLGQPELLRRRLDLLRQDLASDGAAQALLGPRVPGTALRREPIVQASRRLLALIDGWLP